MPSSAAQVPARAASSRFAIYSPRDQSDFLQALLRAHPIDTGNIIIDGNINVTTVDVKALRSIFGLVTQTPFIFSGSLRENLCLDRSVSDDQIHALLQAAELGASLGFRVTLEGISCSGPWLERMGGLDAEVSEGGSNFSFGEKQIICLCRLILSRPKVSQNAAERFITLQGLDRAN